jgi:hypothetical protein
MSAENEEVETKGKIIDKSGRMSSSRLMFLEDVIANGSNLFPTRSGRLYLRTTSCLCSFQRAAFILYRIYFLCLHFFFQHLLPRHFFYYAFSQYLPLSHFCRFSSIHIILLAVPSRCNGNVARFY